MASGLPVISTGKHSLISYISPFLSPLFTSQNEEPEAFHVLFIVVYIELLEYREIGFYFHSCKSVDP